MSKFQSKGSVYIISLLAVILWSMSYIWSDELLRLKIPVEYFVFIRILLAGIILFLYNLIFGYKIKIRREDWWKFLTLAFFEPFIYFICETYGIEFTESPTFSSLIVATAPIFSIVAGICFFKERVNIVNIIGILICLSGIVMVTLSKDEIGSKFVWGVLLLLIAILSEVGHASCTKALSGDYKPEVIVMYQFLIGSAFLSPLFIAKGLERFTYDLYFSWDVFRPILFLSVLCSSIAFSLWVNTIKNLGVAKSSIFLAMIPIFTAIDGWILGKELLTAIQWMGIGVSCVGVVLSQFVLKRNRKSLSTN